MSTFQQLRQVCATRFTDPSNAVIADATSTTQRNWADYINQAYMDVNRASPTWPWLESSEQTLTVAANTRGIALPTDVFQVNWVYDTTNDLRVIPAEGRGDQWRGGYQLRSTTAQIPTTYRVRGNNIEFFPQPTAQTVYVAECVVPPAPLSANSDVPAFPSQFHYILVDGALALAYVDDGGLELAKACSDRFDKQLQQMKNFMLAFRQETYPPVRDAFWG